MERIITGSTTPWQSGPGSNGDEEVINTPQISRMQFRVILRTAFLQGRHICISLHVLDAADLAGRKEIGKKRKKHKMVLKNGRQTFYSHSAYLCACVCVCVCKRQTDRQIKSSRIIRIFWTPHVV